MLQRVPLGRMGTAAEVANLVAFLASEDLSFSTGATFDISGGRATF
jgi:3-oxoacyl-[acyl-carrier protein] reductase